MSPEPTADTTPTTGITVKKLQQHELPDEKIAGPFTVGAGRYTSTHQPTDWLVITDDEGDPTLYLAIYWMADDHSDNFECMYRGDGQVIQDWFEHYPEFHDAIACWFDAEYTATREALNVDEKLVRWHTS